MSKLFEEIRWLGSVVAVALTVFACAHEPKASSAEVEAASPATPAHRAFGELTPVDVAGLNYRYSPTALTEACQAAQARTDARIAALIAVPDAERTFTNSFAAYDAIEGDFGSTANGLAFLKDIHTDEKVRAAAAACEASTNKYLVQLGARKDLYRALRSYADHAGKTDPLAPVDLRLMSLTLRDFRRNGLDLSESDRARLVAIRSRLAELSTRFESNLDENRDSFEATKAELAGLPDSYVARLKKTPNGKYVVTTAYPDYYPLMQEAKSEELRKRAYLTFNSREATRNLPLLTEAVALRDEAAKLLGFATHADYTTEPRMAKSAHAVEEFLERIRGELRPGRDALNAKMLALKVSQTHNRNARLESWDYSYYLEQIKNKSFAVDNETVRSFFPSDKVLAGMLQVYSTVLHVSYRQAAAAEGWAPGVMLYEVHDIPSDRLLAKFYLDLYPRQGKYGHAASFPLVMGRELHDGYQVPLTALVTNFNPPQNGVPSHLDEKEVVTLFHEFGHVMHECLTQAPYATMAGTQVATDFVEAPSQMLENWVYAPEVLKLISADPKNPSNPMPAELAERLAAARTFDAGIMFSRQVVLALFDLRLHTSGAKVDPDALEQKLWHETMGYPVYPSEHMPASFGHLMGGYDAGYYGYLWSKVFAQDMFTRFQRDGVLNGEAGRAYRETILARGQTEEPDVLLQRFLGRAPNEEAFLHLMGITPIASQASGSVPSGMP